MQDSTETFENSHEDLITRAKAGDQSALAELFNHFRARLRRIVEVRMDLRLRGRVDPSDVLQESFIDLAKRLPSFGKQSNDMSVFVWMRLVASERLLNIHRRHLDAQKRDAGRDISIDKQNNNFDASSMCLAGHLLGQFTSAGNRAIRDEMRRVLLATVESMDDIDREIIMIRGFEELSNNEAAEVLDLSPNGASNRYVRAMTRLKKELESIPGFLD